ncbi:MAG: hypothetical protein AAB774_01595 [Patescibacteria group bacterium]|mgnify:CR=1 FL=1
MTINELLAENGKAQATIHKTQLRQQAIQKKLIERIRKGETTDDRQLDLALAICRSVDRDKGQNYLELEQQLQAHPGELVLIGTSWEEDMIKHCFSPPGWHSPTTTEYAYVVGLISMQPALKYDQEGRSGLLLPLEKMLLLRPNFSMEEEVESVKDSVLPVAELGVHFWTWQPNTTNYSVGNEKVLRRLETICLCSACYQGYQPNELLRAFGIEHFQDDGQGVLGEPNPPPIAIS